MNTRSDLPLPEALEALPRARPNVLVSDIDMPGEDGYALIQAGVSADRMETGGFGVARMKCSDSAESCLQRDGRVEVLVRPGS